MFLIAIAPLLALLVVLLSGRYPGRAPPRPALVRG
jgi:hypothetical protein